MSKISEDAYKLLEEDQGLLESSNSWYNDKIIN